MLVDLTDQCLMGATTASSPSTVVVGAETPDRRTRVDIEAPIGIHLVSWTAWVTPEGWMQYGGDPCGGDTPLLEALGEVGVELDRRSG